MINNKYTTRFKHYDANNAKYEEGINIALLGTCT